MNQTYQINMHYQVFGQNFALRKAAYDFYFTFNYNNIQKELINLDYRLNKLIKDLMKTYDKKNPNVNIYFKKYFIYILFLNHSIE